MIDKIAVLARLARLEPSALSPDGWKTLGLDPSTKSPPSYPDLPPDTGWLRHPSGYLVSGRDTVDIIEAARRPQSSSAVFACLSAYCRHYSEPPLRLWRGPQGDFRSSSRVDAGPLVDLLREPSPWYTLDDLLRWCRGQLLVDGNAYLLKIRDGGGTVVTNTTGRLLYLHPVGATVCSPARRPGSTNLVDYYRIDTGRGPMEVPPENVIHFREGIDDADPARGVGAVRAVAREVATDVEASVFVDAVLRNLGIVGLVISPREASHARIDVEAIKSYVMASTTGERRGQPLVFRQPTDIEVIRTDTRVLDLSRVWAHVETRIAAAIGMPAVLAGLQVGLDTADVGANVDGQISYLVKATLMSAWRSDGERWTHGLRREFGLASDEWLGFDTGGLEALSEDQDQRWARVTAAWSANLLTLAQAHNLLDLGEPPEDVATYRLADFEAGRHVPVPFPTPAGQTVDLRAEAASGATGGQKAGATEVDIDAEVTEEDLDAAVAAWDRWARDEAPEFVGMLG